MTLQQDITDRMRVAMRAGNRGEVGVLRMLLSELKVAQTSGQDFDEMDVIKSYAKKLRKTADEYEDLKRADKAQETRDELAVVEEFLPEQMSEEQIEEIVEGIIAENDYGPQDMGQLMKQVMSQYGDRVDGSMVNKIAREKLNEEI